jgi:hypothetical protein
MTNFKKRIFATAIIAGLAVIGSVMNSQQSTVRAAGGPTVTIDQAQLPLPVQGSLGVSGTVAATQSGAWNVGITGTPNVKVTNPATAPVLFVNVNDPGRIPYQSVAANSCSATPSSCQIALTSVPNGHRLVIQHVSVFALADLASTTAAVQVPLQNGFPLISFPATVIPDPRIAGTGDVIVDQSVHAYFDAGQQPAVFVRVSSGGMGTVEVSITGYLLDCTIAPCAAIFN